MLSLDKQFAFNLRDLIQTHQKVIEVSQGFAWKLVPVNCRLGQMVAQAILVVKAGQCGVSGLCKGLLIWSDLFYSWGVLAGCLGL